MSLSLDRPRYSPLRRVVLQQVCTVALPSSRAPFSLVPHPVLGQDVLCSLVMFMNNDSSWGECTCVASPPPPPAPARALHPREALHGASASLVYLRQRRVGWRTAKGGGGGEDIPSLSPLLADPRSMHLMFPRYSSVERVRGLIRSMTLCSSQGLTRQH